MKGTIHKDENGWIIRYKEYIGSGIYNINFGNIFGDDGSKFLDKSLPLHPDDVKRINEWEQIFDNIESRILASPEVEFECVINEIDTTQKFAKLIFKLEPIVDEWKEIEEEYHRDEYPTFGGPFTNALTPWEWLRKWYHPPKRK